MIKSCKICDKEFDTKDRSSKALTCSAECTTANKRNLIKNWRSKHKSQYNEYMREWSTAPRPYVYMVTTPDDSVYLGSTIQKPMVRLRKHFGTSTKNRTSLFTYCRKRGWDYKDLIIDVLGEFNTIGEASTIESKLISQLFKAGFIINKRC